MTKPILDVVVQEKGKDHQDQLLMSVKHVLINHGYRNRVNEFVARATMGNYENLVNVCSQWVVIERNSKKSKSKSAKSV